MTQARPQANHTEIFKLGGEEEARGDRQVRFVVVLQLRTRFTSAHVLYRAQQPDDNPADCLT